MTPTQEEWLAALERRHGKDLQSRFAAATVAVCGLGGLGSNIAIALARAGIGRLILIDFDRVDLTNLHRQQYKANQIGKYKTDALAENLFEMMGIKVPIISVIVGEGGSGGALALGVCDTAVMLENAVYSVISPEGCASILWKDSAKASEAAEALKLTSYDLHKFEVIEKIIEEKDKTPEEIASDLKAYIADQIEQKKKLTTEKLLLERYNKFRKIGA